MKRIFFAIAALLLIGISCEDTNENLVQERGTYVVPKMSDPVPAYFTDNIETSYVQFDLTLSQGETVDKASIEVVNRGVSAIVKDVTLPATGLRITASEVLSALKIPAANYKAGDAFFLYVLTTKNGVTTRSPAAFPIPVVCYFAPSMLVGDFSYYSNDWDEEGDVTIVADPNNPLKVYIYGMLESQGLVHTNGNPIEVNVNTNNFNVTGPKCVLADNLGDWGMPSYTNHAYQAVAGTYSACDNMYRITFNITVDQGGWGNNVFFFTKK